MTCCEITKDIDVSCSGSKLFYDPIEWIIKTMAEEFDEQDELVKRCLNDFTESKSFYDPMFK